MVDFGIIQNLRNFFFISAKYALLPPGTVSKVSKGCKETFSKVRINLTVVYCTWENLQNLQIIAYLCFFYKANCPILITLANNDSFNTENNRRSTHYNLKLFFTCLFPMILSDLDVLLKSIKNIF